MKYSYGKIFRILHNNEIAIKKFDPTLASSYYLLIKAQQNAGYMQVILTSAILFSILKRFQSCTDYRIEKFEFAEDDAGFSQKCDNIIKDAYKNNRPLNNLFEYIDFLTKSENIEIQSVLLNRNFPLSSSIQLKSNGVLRIDEGNFDDVQLLLTDFVQEEFLC